MAVMRRVNCLTCGESKMESRGSADYSNTCRECENKIGSKKRRKFLASKAALTMEERVAQIEAWIYDYKPYVDPLNVLYG